MTKRKRKPVTEIATTGASQLSGPGLLADLRQLIEAAWQQTARAVNSALVGLYWHIGQRIREDVLENDLGEYGKQIVATIDRGIWAGIH